MEKRSFLESRFSEIYKLKKLILRTQTAGNIASFVIFPLAFLGFIYGYFNDTFLASATINGSLFFLYLIALIGLKRERRLFRYLAGIIIIILTLNLTVQLGATPEKVLILFIILIFIAFLDQIPLTWFAMGLFILYLWNEPLFSFGYLQESYFTTEMSNIQTAVILHSAFLIQTLVLTMINLQKRDMAGQAEKVLNAVDELSARFKEQLKYAHEISSGNLDYKPENTDDDQMLQALHEMNDNLKKNAREEKIRNWSISGNAGIGDVLRSYQEDSDELAYEVIKYLVHYLNANQGGFFVVNEEGDEEGSFLELKGAFAYERRKFIEKKIRYGQGMVGQVYLEKELIYMKAVPDDYVTITSGLGDANPTEIVVSPLKVENEVVGVIEIASFNTFENYQLEFLKNISETIGSALLTSKRNLNNTRLLQESRQLTEEMKAQEEEMRQNLEELEATQEDLKRKTVDKEKFEQKLRSERLFLSKIIDSVPEAVYVKDSGLKFQYVNQRFCDLTGIARENILNTSGEKLFTEDSPLSFKRDLEYLHNRKDHTLSGTNSFPSENNVDFKITRSIFRDQNGEEYLIGAITLPER